MHRYLLELSYLGSNFHGFQLQANAVTVQGNLEKALGTLFSKFSPIRVTGASRTDAGVHAEQQFAIFDLPEKIALDKALRSLNALTSNDVGIRSIREVEADFHPIAASTGKVYRYRLWTGKNEEPLLRDFCWWVGGKPIDMDHLEKMLSQTEGTHDFTSFANSGTSVKTFERTILATKVVKKGDMIELWVEGTGFLKQMVRNMVGAAVNLAQEKPNFEITDILKAKDRRESGATAPAKGLALVRVKFEDECTILRGLLNNEPLFSWTLPFQ